MIEQRLTILKGKVKNLHFENATKDFFNDNLQGKAGAAAIGAAAVGAFANAAVLTSISSRARDRVQIFSCEVKGIKLSGCFSAITFEEGDKIEFVVQYDPGNPEEAAVHAARDTKKKILWLLPYQDRSEIAFKKGSLKFIAGISIFVSTLMLIITILDGWINNFDNILFTNVMSMVSIGGGAIFFLLMMIGRNQTIPFAIKATEVFAALGYRNPANVDASDNDLDADIAYEEEYGKSDDYFGNWVNRYQDSDLEK